MQPNDRPQSDWGSDNTQTFIDFGRYFVPEREYQIKLFCDLIPAGNGASQIVELCCGEGLLAGALLEQHPNSTVIGYDGSPDMLAHASDKLAQYGERFQTQLFDLAATDWRQVSGLHAVVSSLAIHHLDDTQKQALFRDIYTMLAPGGVLLIADVIRTADQRGASIAADAWDAAVRRRAQEFDGNDAAFLAFEQERWNMYRYPETDPEPFDKPSLLLDQLNWLVQAGFSSVDVYWMQAGHALFGGRKPLQ